MTKINVSFRIDAPAENVWRLVGAFDGLPRITGEITASRLEEGGRIRRLSARDGSELVERLIYFDDLKRILTYRILETRGVDMPYQAGTYRGTIRVQDEMPGKNCVCDITGEYEPAPGREEEAERETRSFYETCMVGLRKLLGV